jgi:hypothetical protein
VRVDDVGSIETRLGRPAADGHRRRPDGFDLRWKQIGVNDLAADPQLPFFVQWLTDDEHHPSVPGGSVRLAGLEIAGELARIDAYLGTSALQPLDGVHVDWTPSADGDTGVAAAVFETASGPVRID